VADRRAWSTTRDAMTVALGPFRAIAYDRRGFGTSTFTPETHSRVGDLIAVLDGCGVDAAVPIGNSQGGRIAIDTALTHPHRVKALVLIGSAVSGSPTPQTWPDRLVELRTAIDTAEESGDIDAANELEAQLWLDGPSAPAGRVGGAARALFLNMNGIALRAEEVGDVTDDVDAWNLLATLQIPVLVMVGSLDLEHLVESGRHMALVIPGAELVILDGCAHVPSVEAPQRTAEVIADFLHRRC
jgi:pimeloyl-ACP methyl ester carboxylesterase